MTNRLPEVLESNSIERLATGFVFTEGPLWHPEGYWLFVDIRRSLIFSVAPGAEPQVERDNSGGSNGLTFDRQGRLIMCEGDNRRLTRRDGDGSISVFVDQWEGKKLNRPNDLVGRSDGTVYFTNPNGRIAPEDREIDFGGVHAVRPDGSQFVAIDEFEYPNGLAFSPDERILYVSNTRVSKHIETFDVAENGTLSNGRVWADMSSDEPDGVPDGMKVDVEGRVYCTGPGGCWVFDSDGSHMGIIRLPEIPANVAWGGDDHRTLLFTAQTSIYTMRMTIEGTRIPTL